MRKQQYALIEVAITAMGSLPESGQIEVFNHLDKETREKIASAALASMSDVTRRQFLSTLPAVPTTVELQQVVSATSDLEGLDYLRQKGRVHGVEAYAKLGIEVKGAIPEISDEILQLCLNAPVESMIFLDIGCSLIDLAALSRNGWTMHLGKSVQKMDFAKETHNSTHYVVVPMEGSSSWHINQTETLGLSKVEAIRAVQRCCIDKNLEIVAPDPRLLAIGVLLHERDTGRKLFQKIYTHTNEKNVVVGWSGAEDCFLVQIIDGIDNDGVKLSGYNNGYQELDYSNRPVRLVFAPSGIKKS